MEVDNESVGSRIKQIRLSKGWTLEELGGKLGTSKVTVFNWEKGRNKPNKENLKKIAELGGITVDELLYGTLEERVVYLTPLVVDQEISRLLTSVNQYGVIANKEVGERINKDKNFYIELITREMLDEVKSSRQFILNLDLDNIDSYLIENIRHLFGYVALGTESKVTFYNNQTTLNEVQIELDSLIMEFEKVLGKGEFSGLEHIEIDDKQVDNELVNELLNVLKNARKKIAILKDKYID